MEFLKINVVFGIVDSDKYNAIDIFNLKLWLKYFWFSLLLVTIQQCVLPMAAIYCSLCVEDLNLCKLNN